MLGFHRRLGLGSHRTLGNQRHRKHSPQRFRSKKVTKKGNSKSMLRPGTMGQGQFTLSARHYIGRYAYTLKPTNRRLATWFIQNKRRQPHYVECCNVLRPRGSPGMACPRPSLHCLPVYVWGQFVQTRHCCCFSGISVQGECHRLFRLRPSPKYWAP